MSIGLQVNYWVDPDRQDESVESVTRATVVLQPWAISRERGYRGGNL